jgi:hypothetical protein
MRRRVSFFAFDPELTKHTKYVSTFLRYFMLHNVFNMKQKQENRSGRLVEMITGLVLKLFRRADYDPIRIYLKTKRAQQRRFSF